jgi:hypothetical protein
MTTIEELIDWRAVFDLSIRYGAGIDRRDWAMYRSCFADVVNIDFSSFSHQPAPATPMSADDFVGTVRSLIEGFESTQHLIANHAIDVDGDEGRYTAYIQAQHWMSRERWYLIGGWYDNQCRRENGTWKITQCVLHQTWDAGDRSLLRQATGRYRDRNAR